MRAPCFRTRSWLLGLGLLCLCACGRKPEWDLTALRAAEQANQAEIDRALAAFQGPGAEDMRFVVENMPIQDRGSLSAGFLIENAELAYAARAHAPWGAQMPRSVFQEALLPYAQASEPREPWRRVLRQALIPRVADCRTPTEAAQRVNEIVFRHFGVDYSDRRERADQSPGRTIELGIASCTGLSIFLCAALRSVGVAARVAAIPAWPQMPGNHTWVEFWDQGWHCIAPNEPWSPIDATWYLERLLHARKRQPRHAAYALTFRSSDGRVPVGWARDVPVYGRNVTDRYVPRYVHAEQTR